MRSRLSRLRIGVFRRSWWEVCAALSVMVVIAAGGLVPVTVAAQGVSPEAIAEAAKIQLPDDPAVMVAMVGKSPILLGDLLPKIDSKIALIQEKSPQPIPPVELRGFRVMMFRGMLQQMIRNKMLRESFVLEQVATQSAEKRREARETMEAKARQTFAENRLPELKKMLKTESLAEIDEKLRAEGSSLQALQREFADQMLGHLYLRSKVQDDQEVAPAELIAYYRSHEDEYRHAARARWEQLTVYFKNFPTRAAAREAIWGMLQEARFGGSMQAVAREKSQEPFARDGGVHDWTHQGSLASDALDRVLFDPAMPLGQISDVIEDEDAFHVIRLLEREPAGLTPLRDVQAEIENKIKAEKMRVAETEAMKRVMERVPVWSMFPEDIPGAKPLRVAGVSTNSSQR